MRRFTFIFFLLVCTTATTTLGQNIPQKGLLHYWTFGNVKDTGEIQAEIGKNIPGQFFNGVSLSNSGYIENSCMLGREENTYIKVDNGINFYNHFSLGFWMLASHLDSKRTVFHQFSNNRYIKVFFEDEMLIFDYDDGRYNQNKIRFELRNFQPKEWNYILITLEGSKLRLYSENELIDEKEIKLNLRESQVTDELIWGNGKSLSEPFIGEMDEIFMYDHALAEFDRNKLYHYFLERRKSKPDPGPEPVEIYKDSINVSTDDLYAYIKIWDYRKVDNDSIALFINDIHIKDIGLRAKRYAYSDTIMLKPGIPNTLIVKALNTGIAGPNTAEVKIIVGRKSHNIRLDSDKDKSEGIIINTPDIKKSQDGKGGGW